MRLLVLSLIFTLACGDDSAEDASVPADVGEDTGDTGRDSIDSPDVAVRDAGTDTSGPRVWDHEPRLEVVSTECEDWDEVPRSPRALPEDATPRILWRYRPADDPLYSFSHADGRSYVGAPVVSPDGTIWVHGPRTAHVTQLTRDGRMRRWFQAGGADENDPGIGQRLGDLLALPDGVVVGPVYSTNVDSPGGFLSRMNPQDPFEIEADIDGGLVVLLTERPRLAAGPGGLVYALSGDRLYATCKAERLLWTLTNVAAADAPLTWSMSHLFVEPDGSVVVSGGAERAYRVRPGAEEVEAFLPIEAAPHEIFQFGPMTPEHSLVMAHDGERLRIELLGSEPPLRYSNVERLGLSPTGRVTFRITVPSFIEPPYDGEPETAEILGQYGPSSRWFEDGDWISGGLARHTGQGEEVWRVSAEEGATIRSDGALDEQGVYFSMMSVGGFPIELVAVQTDGLPAPLTMCVDNRCNAQHDRWIRPE